MKTDNSIAYSLQTSYRAPWWLSNRHAQTIYPLRFRFTPNIPYSRKRLERGDGDFIDFDWLKESNLSKPTVIIFHGLEGSSQSHYIKALMKKLQHMSWSGVVPNFRGCSGSPNRLQRAYHSGDHDEIDWMIKSICEKTSKKCFVIGFSLGGNALLKWLSLNSPIASKYVKAAVAISVPFDLSTTGDLLDKGFNKIYSYHFLKSLKKKCLIKKNLLASTFDLKAILKARSIREFDNLYTAPAHGFKNADHYWSESSSYAGLPEISIPTFLLHAKNDPFYPGDLLPSPNTLPKNFYCLYTETGGHVGFNGGTFAGNLSWLPNQVVSFFEQF